MRKRRVARFVGLVLISAFCLLLEVISVSLATISLHFGHGNCASAATSLAAPTLVSPGNGGAAPGTSVRFEWGAVDGAVDYKLFVSTNSNPFDAAKRKVAILVGNVTSYVGTEYPANGTKYYWWVVAFDTDGTYSSWSEVMANGRWFTNTSPPPLAAPALVSPASGESVAGASVPFEWSAVDGAVDYRLIVSTSTDPFDLTKRKTAILAGNVTYYVDTGYPANGTRYYWWVSAYDAEGRYSAWSSVMANGKWFANTPVVMAAPALVSPASGESVAGASVPFEWSAVDGATDYKLFVSISSNPFEAAKRKIALLVGNVTSYVATGYAANGTKYYWWVMAFDGSGNRSAWSSVLANAKSFTNTPVTVAAPALASPADGESVAGTSVPLEWNAVSGAVDYRLIVSTSGNPFDLAKRKIALLVGNVTNYVDTGYPASGTKYYWWVSAYNAEGRYSAWSSVLANGRSFTNSPVTIAAPALVSPANGGSVAGNFVPFEWSAVSGAVDYRLIVSTSSNPFDLAKRKTSILAGNVTDYVDTGYPANGTKYYWWVSAYNAEGRYSPWSGVQANGRSFFSVSVTGSTSVGDFVWDDLNENGVQDQGEPGLYNVTVELYGSSGSLIGSIATDNYGYYLFSNVVPGSYYLQFVAPTGYVFSPAGQGSDPAGDSDANDDGATVVFSLASGQNDVTRDAGLYRADSGVASVGDFVWRDLNRDGIQDTGESGLVGVEVNLFDCGGQIIATTATDANGSYSFRGVTPGAYKMTVVAPAGYVFSPKSQGSDAAKDSDANADGKIDCFTLVSGQNDVTRDAGLYLADAGAVSVGDLVWEDRNGNGIQDAGEPGLVGVAVDLFECNDKLVGTTTTDANGVYAFPGVTPGDYRVVFVAPAGYLFSAKGQGSDSAKDSDADSDGKTDCFNLVSGQNDVTRDAGLHRADSGVASVGDLVWEDLNGNGIHDSGESGLVGVAVNLLQCNEKLVGTTTTDANGVYAFPGVTPGDYRVVFVAPAGYLFSAKGQGGDAAKDSDANGDGKTDCFTLVSGQIDVTRDAGLHLVESGEASVGDFVWEDLNANGVQDPGEGGLPDVTVELYSSGGAQLGSTATDGSGHYEFSGLAPGSYYLKVHAPAGFAFSPKGKGSDVGKDSDANSDGRTDRFTLVSGQKDVSRDFGLYERASFDPLVWEDVNGNGVQDQGESGLYNVTVELHGCDGLLAASTTTDVKGYYIFSSVMPGSYYVEFVAPAGYLFCPKGQGGDATRDSDADVDGRTDCFNLVAGENDVVRDAGLYRRASVGDLVWEDVNEDGVQDEGEDGLCNVTVELHGGDGWLVASTTTDASGRYSFSELTPGNYYLRFVAPAGYRFSPKSQGGDGGMGSCAPSPTGETECFALASGEHGSIWDAGLYKEEKSPRRTIPALATWVGLVAATMVLTGSGLLVLRGGARFGNK